MNGWVVEWIGEGGWMGGCWIKVVHVTVAELDHPDVALLRRGGGCVLSPQVLIGQIPIILS